MKVKLKEMMDIAHGGKTKMMGKAKEVGHTEMIQVKAHKRAKSGGRQGHPAKPSQPLSMKYI